MGERISNIDSIVTSTLNQMKDYGLGQKDYAWLMNIAVGFYSDRLRGFNMPSLVCEKFPVDLKTRIWSFPSDYMRYTKIAYKMGNSMGINILGLNEDLNISNPIGSCAEPIQSAPPMQEGYWLAGVVDFSGAVAQPLYATGGGFAENYYRPDYHNRCIRFNDNLPVGMAFIEYLSSGKGVDGSTLVPLTYRAAFEMFLKAEICLLRKGLINIEPLFRRQFNAQMWDSNLLEKGLTEQEHRDVVYRASGFNLR